jgi:hypothetical protein
MFKPEMNGIENSAVNSYRIGYFSETLKQIGMPNAVPSLVLARVTWAEAKYLAEMADKLIMETPEGAEYKLKKIFNTSGEKQQTYGPPPGTVRMFSRQHISYYTGKSWKKLSLPS